MEGEICCSQQVFWLFQSLERHCNEYFIEQNLSEVYSRLTNENWTDKNGIVFKQLTSPQIYVEMCKFLFTMPSVNKPIDLLQRYGYFVHGDKNLFNKRGENNIDDFVSLIECLMWVLIDRHPPRIVIQHVVGRQKISNCQDTESLLCLWINTIVAKHVHLTPLSLIGNSFLGLPHMRIIFFHYSLDDSFNAGNDTNENNFRKILEACDEYKIATPFNRSQIFQPPLVIITFLCESIPQISKIKPKTRSRSVSDAQVIKRIDGIKQLRGEVKQLEKRVSDLHTQVKTIEINMPPPRQRPKSMLATRTNLKAPLPPLRDPMARPTNLRDQKGSSSERRVRWDPSVTILARSNSSRAQASNKNEFPDDDQS